MSLNSSESGFGATSTRIVPSGRNRYPAVTGFETGISDQAESKLVQVKLQASIPIANKNCAFENTQVGVLPIQAGSARVDPTG
jgi:hypothetical protein